MNHHFDMMVTASLQALQVVDTPWAGLSAAPDETAKGLQTSFSDSICQCLESLGNILIFLPALWFQVLAEKVRGTPKYPLFISKILPQKVQCLNPQDQEFIHRIGSWENFHRKALY